MGKQGNYRINVKNIYYALNTKDEDGSVTRETPQIMAEAMKVSVNPKVAAGKLYGDGKLVEDVNKLTGAEIALDATIMPTEIISELFGRTKDSGGVTKDNIADEAVEFSIGWEVELSNKQSEFVWFTKCKAQPLQSEIQQSEENVNFSTDTINIVAMPDENGDIRLFGDTTDPDFKCKDTWFASVPPVPPNSEP